MKTTNVVVVLSESVHKKLKFLAREEKRSMSSQIALVIEQWITEKEKGKG